MDQTTINPDGSTTSGQTPPIPDPQEIPEIIQGQCCVTVLLSSVVKCEGKRESETHKHQHERATLCHNPNRCVFVEVGVVVFVVVLSFRRDVGCERSIVFGANVVRSLYHFAGLFRHLLFGLLLLLTTNALSLPTFSYYSLTLNIHTT